jgi:hypothetical protein
MQLPCARSLHAREYVQAFDMLCLHYAAAAAAAAASFSCGSLVTNVWTTIYSSPVIHATDYSVLQRMLR